MSSAAIERDLETSIPESDFLRSYARFVVGRKTPRYMRSIEPIGGESRFDPSSRRSVVGAVCSEAILKTSHGESGSI